MTCAVIDLSEHGASDTERISTMTQLSSEDAPHCKPLSKHKMALLTFIGLLAPVYFIPRILSQLFPEQMLLVTVLAVAIIVALMSYLIVPFLTWVFRGWITPDV